MRSLKTSRTFAVAAAVFVLAAASASGQTNRWVSIGPRVAPPGVPTVQAIAFGRDGALFVGDNQGVFRHAPDGSWDPVLQVPSFRYFTIQSAFLAVSTQPGAPDTMLAGMSGGGVYRSVDAGATWTNVLIASGFLSLATAPFSPTVTYASVLVAMNDIAATFKSTDGGATWTGLPALGTSPVFRLAVDPFSDDVVYGIVGPSGAGLPAGVYRSGDGGASWAHLDGLPAASYRALAIDPSSSSVLYAGSDGSGVFRSEDSGATWSPASAGLENLDVEALVVDPLVPTTVYAGTGRGVFRSVDGAAHWSPVGLHGSAITTLALDPASPSTLYAALLGGGLGRVTLEPVAPCDPDAETLCLNGGRFRVQATYRGRTIGTEGDGQAFPITGDTGAFWFFDPANLELVVKVLDGTATNGYFWVFIGGLSGVESMVTVTDTRTGMIQSYYHDQYYPPASLGDTSAFPAAATPEAAPSPPAFAAGASCTPDGNTLCLQGGRFQVHAEWQASPEGPVHEAPAVSLTPDTGYFWFFGPANVEVVVKVLDGTWLNGKYWVFYGSLSDVAYILRVTDTLTGAERTYVNPQGRMTSLADTSAF